MTDFEQEFWDYFKRKFPSFTQVKESETEGAYGFKDKKDARIFALLLKRRGQEVSITPRKWRRNYWVIIKL